MSLSHHVEGVLRNLHPRKQTDQQKDLQNKSHRNRQFPTVQRMLKSQREVAVLQKSRNATSRDLLDWGEACGVTVTRSRSTRLGLTRNLSCYVYVVFMLCLQLPFPVQSIKQVGSEDTTDPPFDM